MSFFLNMLFYRQMTSRNKKMFPLMTKQKPRSLPYVLPESVILSDIPCSFIPKYSEIKLKMFEVSSISQPFSVILGSDFKSKNNPRKMFVQMLNIFHKLFNFNISLKNACVQISSLRKGK